MPHPSILTARLSLLAFAGVLLALLTGCALQNTALPTPIAIPAFSGTVHGGQQPVSNSAIQLYAVGDTGYASAATPLITGTPVTTDSTGSFTITGDFKCPSATTQVYLTATGGNPGLADGADNTALALMAALGDCGNLTAGTQVVINEVTTVGAVWALQQFMSGYANVGATSTNAAGIAAAFTNATSIARVACGCALPSSTSTIMPQYTINTLADVLASCVNSTGSTDSGTPCANLFSAATPPGGAAPTNTIGAALNIALHPGSNVTAIYNIATATAPFQPTLAAAPNDWTVSILTPMYAKYFSGAAMNSTGLCIAYYYDGSSVCGTSLGVSNASSPTFDAAGDVWFGAIPISAGPNEATLYELGPAYSPVTSYTFPSDNETPEVVAFDSTGNAWIEAGTLTIMSGAGVTLVSSYSGVYGTIADTTGGLWTISDANTLLRSTVSGSTVATSTYTGATGATSGNYLAFDHAGNLWSEGSGTLLKFTVSGSSASAASFSGGGLTGGRLLVDGDSNAWILNSSSISAFNNDGVPLTPSTGLGVYIPANSGAIDGYQPLVDTVAFGIDASGDVLALGVAPNFDASINPYYLLDDFIGLAAPTVNPLALAAATNTIGARP